MSNEPSNSRGRSLKRRLIVVALVVIAGFVAKRFGLTLPGLSEPTSKEASKDRDAGRQPSPREERRDDPPVRRYGPEAPNPGSQPPRPERGGGTMARDDGGAARVAAFRRDKRSRVMVTVRGIASAILPPDRDGKPHQRFILKLSDSTTLLVAHNLSLAGKVPLERWDEVEIKGQFEWSEKGGVLHWTHHDPAKRHEEGWIRHKGKIYQ